MQQEASCPPVTVLTRPLSPNEYIHLQEREASVASFRVTTLYESNPLAMRTLARKISCNENSKCNETSNFIESPLFFFFYKLNIH